MKELRYLSECLTREVGQGTAGAVEIDTGITNLIMLLNQHGYETLFSCEGHGDNQRLYFVIKSNSKSVELVYGLLTKLKTQQAHGVVGGFLFSNVGDPIKGAGCRWNGITFYTTIKNKEKFDYKKYNKHLYTIFKAYLTNKNK